MIPEFALRLICGLSTVWCIAPRSQITSGFFRIQMLVTLGLGVLLVLTSNQFVFPGVDGQVATSSAMWAGTSIAIVSFLGAAFWSLERRKGGTVFGFVVATLAYLELGLVALCQPTPFPVALLDQLTASWLIGSVTAAMLLGHWYLTATGMSLTPLVRLNVIFAIALVLRGLAVVADYTMAKSVESPAWTLLILRWAGLIGPFILAILTIRILRYRNTQSATGVLYAATILVFMGEMAARLS